MELEPAMDVLLDPLVPCAVALIYVSLSAPDVAQNMSDDQLNHMERVDYMDGIGKVTGYIFLKRTVHVCDEIFDSRTFFERDAFEVWFCRLLQKDGDSTSILKNRVVECPDIWAPGVHPMIADRTICRFTSLAYHDLNRRWRRLGDVGYNISVFEAK